jgi:hypothetical protein
MELSSINSVLLIIFFIIPGFLAEWIFSSFIQRSQRESTTVILESLAFSCLIYSLVLPITYQYNVFIFSHFIFFGILFLLIVPISLCMGSGFFFQSNFYGKFSRVLGIISPIPKAWDYFFGNGEPCLVLITLQDDTKIGGLWHTNSFASSFPSEEDIYLEAQYQINDEGRFLDEIPDTQGCLVRAGTIKFIEFFKIQPKEETHGEEN